MLLNKLKLSLSNINVRKDAKYCIVMEIVPLQKYGAVPPEIIGSKLICLGTGNMSFAVKIFHDASQPLTITKEMIEQTQAAGLMVEFENLEITAYCFIEKETGKLKQGVNATASGVRLVNDGGTEIVI